MNAFKFNRTFKNKSVFPLSLDDVRIELKQPTDSIKIHVQLQIPGESFDCPITWSYSNMIWNYAVIAAQNRVIWILLMVYVPQGTTGFCKSVIVSNSLKTSFSCKPYLL